MQNGMSVAMIVNLIGGGMTAVGGLVLLIAIVVILQQRSRAAGGRRAAGVIVELKHPSNLVARRHPHRASLPVVEFKTDAGQSVRFESPIGGPGYAVGQAVEVFYDPADPQKAALPVSMASMVILIGVGGFFFCVGAGVLAVANVLLRL